MELAGKTAIVTGGAVRIGKALSLALARAGVRVAVHYGHSEEQARQTVDAIVSSGGTAIGIQADLCDPYSAARSIIEQATKEFGQIDFLINNAAIFAAENFTETTEADWDRHFSINLKAPFFLSQKFAAEINPGRRAQIVNIADWRAQRPQSSHIAYTLTKSALVTLTRSLAQELAPRVQVNAIAPGAILPPPDKDRDYLEALAAQIPLRTIGSPNDIADALLFLLRSDSITGEVIHVTGGEHL